MLRPRRPPIGRPGPVAAAVAGTAVGASLAAGTATPGVLAVVTAVVAAVVVLAVRRRRAGARAAVDHEIRNIAGGLMAAHALLARDLPAEDLDVVRAGVRAELARLWSLAGGAGPGPATHLDVGAVVAETAAARGHPHGTVRVVGRPAATCDDAALRSAVGDCLVNAERYAPGSALTVVVRATAHRARIDITDRGPAPGRRPLPPGTGRGLAHAGQVLDRFGGSVSLHREPAGARARIELPLADPGAGSGAGSGVGPGAGTGARPRPWRLAS